MRFDVMTLFPDLIEQICSASIIGRAREAGKIAVTPHNIRDYSTDKFRRVDDTPYGGGHGMLMSVQPIYDCHQAIPRSENSRTIYMSPTGARLTQKKAAELAQLDQIIILCGHYEGVDRRAIELICDEELSIGDYVLTGGELPACVLIDTVGRLVTGVLSDDECHEIESISCGMLEFPQYTRPAEFMGLAVPTVLTEGNHKQIEQWRNKAALELTRRNRPDLL